MHIASLYRYPVKGLSPERLHSVRAIAGEGLPLDRRYALLRTAVEFDPLAPAWLAKANFVMLMLHERIAQLKTRYTDNDKMLHIRTPAGSDLEFSLEDAAGRTALEKFFLKFMPECFNPSSSGTFSLIFAILSG